MDKVWFGVEHGFVFVLSTVLVWFGNDFWFGNDIVVCLVVKALMHAFYYFFKHTEKNYLEYYKN